MDETLIEILTATSAQRQIAIEDALDAIDNIVLAGTPSELRVMNIALGKAQDAIRNLLADE